MFTGIIEAIGRIDSVQKSELGQELTIETPFHDLKLGESVAVNGVCLTVARLQKSNRDRDIANFLVSPETIQRTNIGDSNQESIVNLERALLANSRLSGHLVQGHVDGIAELVSLESVGECFELSIKIPQSCLKYTVEKGSLCLDGISLTINRIEGDILYFMIIPHTWTHTILHKRKPGDRLNFEVDVIAKYAERLCTPFQKS